VARSSTYIQLEITAIETRLQSADSMLQSVSADGTSVTAVERKALESRLDDLYQMLDRATGASPMFVRGRVKGL
jgi:hypothetical protein